GTGWRLFAGYDLAQDLVLRVMVGGIAYIGARVILWIVMGRPEGLEREAANMVGKLRRRPA
ncbi:hypothetical protein, partial [Escherichia coli]